MLSEIQSSDDGLKIHPDRNSALQEVHARPHLTIENPGTVFHFAFLYSPELAQQLIADLSGNGADPKIRHFSGEFCGFTVKLERHTEFVSLTFKGSTKQTAPEVLGVLGQLVPKESVELFAALQLRITHSTKSMLDKLAFGQRAYGGSINSNIEVLTTLIPSDEGLVVFSLKAPKQSGDELGRRIQRLIEFETYRTLCLVGLPSARRTSAAITAMDATLHQITMKIAQTTNASEEDISSTFDNLVDLSARADALRAETKFRFSASLAYYALVQQRMQALNETKIGDVQRLSNFVKSRLDPAIATIESVAQRQQVLSDDLGRALTLLRTRIELNMNRSNQASLHSMNLRHKQQLLISQTVEGLSIIAITYYCVGLLGYVFKAAMKAQLLPVSIEVATAISIPIVFGGAFASLRRLRKHWDK